MTVSQSVLCVRLSSLGLKQNTVHGILNTVQKWIRCNGPEWTVKRLKDLKTCYIHHLADLPAPVSWISKHADGRPKGHFGTLWKGTSVKHRAKALNALMCYTTQVSPVITSSQRDKFFNSVENPPAADPRVYNFFKKPKGWKKVSDRVSYTPSTIRDLLVSSSRRAPVKGTHTVRESDVEAWWDPAQSNGCVRIAKSRFPGCFEGLKPFLNHKQMPDWSSPSVVGKISFIQEPGFKLRAVANPNRVLQLALRPLQSVLLLALKQVESDCTFDQSKGVNKVQGWLKDGEQVHSVDLSDATNNFPLFAQLKLLEDLLPSKWLEQIRLFEYCSTQPWSVTNDKTVTWKKGQPLGLGPSFMSFALAHHALVLNLGIPSSHYAILGDDIVIKGNTHAERYKRALKHLGCPISESKTIASAKVAEFAGKVILPDAVIHPFKWKDSNDRSFIDIARNMGPNIVQHLKPRQRKVVELVAQLPEEFGGLGWNPHGLPYLDRVNSFWSVYRQLELTTNLVQVRNQESFEFEMALRLQKTTRVSWKPWKELKFRELPQTDSIPAVPKDVRHRIMKQLNIVTDKVESSVPEGYSPMAVESDPRGKTTLQVLEGKLRSSLQTEDMVSSSPRQEEDEGVDISQLPVFKPPWIK